jgi:hypothetical protein
MSYSGDEKPDLSQPLPFEIMERFEKGKTTKTIVLHGTEQRRNDAPLYAVTHVEIDFDDEAQMLNCVKLLYWSDLRLSKLPALLAKWKWDDTKRSGNQIQFSTSWYDKDFFEARNAAFLGRTHAHYYEMFGAKVGDLKIRHEIKS